MMLSRRNMLKLALIGAAHPLLPVRGIVSQAFAAPGAADAKFLLVFLRGGYDAANVVIPVGSDFYYESRPTIALPKPDASNPNAALSLARPGEAAVWGLHPALKESMLPLWQKGQLAFVPFAGTEDLTRSHFETQDNMESGMPVSAPGSTPRAYGSGFLNRLAAALDGTAAPVAFTDGLPMAMTGEVVVPNVSLRGTGKPAFDDRQVGLLTSMYEGTRFAPLIAEGFDLRRTVAQQAEMMAAGGMAGEMQAANRNAITATGFALEARRMAGLMKDKFNIGFIDVGGWDTHVNQGGAQGQLATLLTSLGQGFRENGTHGTDHGHGSVHWVLGGAVQGGRFAGEQMAVTQKSLNQNRDFPVLTEYRAMLGGMFKRMYLLDNARLDRVFPNTVSRDLGLV